MSMNVSRTAVIRYTIGSCSGQISLAVDGWTVFEPELVDTLLVTVVDGQGLTPPEIINVTLTWKNRNVAPYFTANQTTFVYHVRTLFQPRKLGLFVSCFGF